MRSLGIEAWAGPPFQQLSGGQQQLVIVARAIASDARVLFLDEPASALDLRRQEEVLAEGRAVVFTTHDPSHAERIADEAVVPMPDGVAQSGSRADVLTPEVLRALPGITLEHARTPSGVARLVPVYSHLSSDSRSSEIQKGTPS